MTVTTEMFRSRVSSSLSTTVTPPAVLEDTSRWQNVGTFTNITRTRWPSGVWSLDFAGNSYIEVPAANSIQCNFTSEDFTVLTWLYSTGIGAAQYIVCQGATDVDGWGLFVFVNNLSLRLNQGGAHTDISAVNGFAFGRWQLVGVTRSGNTGQFYNNGQAIATIGGGGLANAVSVAGGNKLMFGIADGGILNGLTGSEWSTRIYLGAFDAGRMATIFEEEKGWFGVN